MTESPNRTPVRSAQLPAKQRASFRGRRGSAVSWFALVVAVLALILSVIAFNRSGGDISSVFSEQLDTLGADLRSEVDAVRQTAEQQAERFNAFVQNSQNAVEESAEAIAPEAELAAARTAAAVRLAAIDVSDASANAFEAAREEVSRAREELSEAYSAAEQEASEEWSEIQAELDLIEAELEQENTEVGLALRELAVRLDPDVLN